MQNRISILRREKGVSLTDLAKAAGTTKAQIQKLERGDRRLSLDWMDRIARALDVKISDLLPADVIACRHGPEDREILEIVSQLPPEDRAILVRIAAGLLDTMRSWSSFSDAPAVPEETETASPTGIASASATRRRRGA
jgi:transcriptional regulator with XRE-family HTH domain